MKEITLSAAWNAEQLSQHEDWIYQLSADEIKEINNALKMVQDLDYPSIQCNQFLLPQLSHVIANKFSSQLETGIGALLIRGLDTNAFELNVANKLLWGLGLHFGVAVSQSPQGELLHEVKDEGFDIENPKARGANTNLKLCFHNDPCDVAVLFCLRQGASGGESRLVSSVSIHNAMLRNYPELLKELYKPYYFRRHNVDTGNKLEYVCYPIFAIEQGHFVCNILRRLIDKAQELPDVPRLTPLQIKALDVFESLAESPELCHEFLLKPGDILLFNNYVTLHSRKAFINSTELDKQRLLLRLWLSVVSSRPLPESYRATYHEIESGAIRGGLLPEKRIEIYT